MNICRKDDFDMVGKRLEKPVLREIPVISKSKRVVNNNYVEQPHKSELSLQKMDRRVRSKKLDLPVRDEMMVGGFRNLKGFLGDDFTKTSNKRRYTDGPFYDSDKLNDFDMDFL